MNAIGREALLAVRGKLTSVSVPECGPEAAVFVRVLTGHERGAIEKTYSEKRPQDDPAGFRGALLVRCLCDESGTRLFTDTDVAALMELPAGLLERLFEVATQLNGFTGKDIEELEKN